MPNLRKYLKIFAIESFLLAVLLATVAANLNLRLSAAKNQTPNRSWFFMFLKNHPSSNQRLAETYQSVNLKITKRPTLEKQILAASTKDKTLNIASASSALPTLSGTALLKPHPASSQIFLPKRDIEIYTVRGGDTVARIASAYGISVNTILWENNLGADGLIRPGQELRLLSTTGIKHIIKEGETLEAVAKKYQVDLEIILEYNEIEIPDFITVGEEIIIPEGVKPVPPTPKRRQYLADLQREDYKQAEVPADYQGPSSALIWPLPQSRHISQGYKRRHPAVDITGNHLEVVAASRGIVVLSGWFRGYGQTIEIDHGGGLKTRYGHGSKLLVAAGQEVAQGQTIMLSGSSGRSTGPHLHFEVRKNGVFLNPLKVIGK